MSSMMYALLANTKSSPTDAVSMKSRTVVGGVAGSSEETAIASSRETGVANPTAAKASHNIVVGIMVIAEVYWGGGRGLEEVDRSE